MVGFGTLAMYAFGVRAKAKREKAAALEAQEAKNKISFIGQDSSGNWSTKASGTDFGDGFTASYMRIGDSVQKLDRPVTYESVYNFNGSPLTKNEIIQTGGISRGKDFNIADYTKIGQKGDNKYDFFPNADKILSPEKEVKKGVNITYTSGVKNDTTKYRTYQQALEAGGNRSTIREIVQKTEDGIVVDETRSFLDPPEEKEEKTISNNVYRVLLPSGTELGPFNSMGEALEKGGPDANIFQDTQKIGVTSKKVIETSQGSTPLNLGEEIEDTNVIYRAGPKQKNKENPTNEFTDKDSAEDYAKENNIKTISTIELTTKGKSTKENLVVNETLKELEKKSKDEKTEDKTPKEQTYIVNPINNQGKIIKTEKGLNTQLSFPKEEWDQLSDEEKNQYNLVRIDQTDSDGKILTPITDFGKTETGSLLDAAEKANAQYYHKFELKDDSIKEFTITDTVKSPSVQLAKLKTFMNDGEVISLLQTMQGKTMSLEDDDPALINFRASAAEIIVNEMNKRFGKVDSITGTIAPDPNLILKVESHAQRYHKNLLDRIPGLLDELKIISGITKRENINRILEQKKVENPGSIVKIHENNASVTTPEGEVDTTILFPVVVPKEYTKLGEKVVAAMASLGIDKEEAALRFSNGVVYAKDPRTFDVIYDENKDPVAAEDQPIYSFLQRMTDMKGSNGKPLLDTFIQMIKIADANQYTSLNPDDYDTIKKQFSTAIQGDLEKGIELIRGFAAGGDQIPIALLTSKYGSNWQQSKEYAAAQAQEGAALLAKKTALSMQNGYFTEDGEEIGLNAMQGQFYLDARDIVQLLTSAKEAGLQLIGKTPSKVSESYLNSINNIRLKHGGTAIDSTLDDANLPAAEREAKARNKALLDEIMAEANHVGEKTVVVDGKSKRLSQDTVRKLAQRKYLKYMLAYQMAAAIQGGTGGRTISDQDVENILNALNFRSGIMGLITDSRKELMTLQKAAQMMDYIYLISKYKSSNSHLDKFAVEKLQDLTADSDLDGITLDSRAIARFLVEDGSNLYEQQRAKESPLLKSEKEGGLSDAAKLEVFNNLLVIDPSRFATEENPDPEPFDSWDNVTKSIPNNIIQEVFKDIPST